MSPPSDSSPSLRRRSASLELVDVYASAQAPRLLYGYLARRPKDTSINHHRMPKYSEHLRFVNSRPYKSWYLLRSAKGEFFGAVYLTKRDEIGIYLEPEFQGLGLGTVAVKRLIARHRDVRRFLANISPKNPGSMRFFESLRFKHIQNTYELER